MDYFLNTFTDGWTHFADAIVAPSFAHIYSTTAILFRQLDGQFIATLSVASNGCKAVSTTCIYKNKIITSDPFKRCCV